jgi:hypothetical protein
MSFPTEDARHEPTERLGKREDDHQKEQDLKPAIVCHGQNFSGRSIA